MINNDRTVIFGLYEPRETEWDTARWIEASRYPNGSVCIRISTETEREDAEYKDTTLSATEAEAFGKALLCIPEDEDFGEIMSRAATWEE